jgi:hypothetical protein
MTVGPDYQGVALIIGVGAASIIQWVLIIRVWAAR